MKSIKGGGWAPTHTHQLGLSNKVSRATRPSCRISTENRDPLDNPDRTGDATTCFSNEGLERHANSAQYEAAVICTPLGVFYHILRHVAHYAGAPWGSSCIVFCDERPLFWLGDLCTNHPCRDPPMTITNRRFGLLASQIVRPRMYHCALVCISVHQSASVYFTVREFASLCISVHHRVSVCITVHHCASLCITLHPCASVCIKVHRCASLRISVHQCASLCISVHHCASRCITVHQCASVCITAHECALGCIRVH